MHAWALMATASLVATVQGSPNVIADHRIRNPNRSPALGRGYSLQTHDVLSTCLKFDQLTNPSYNYDYDFLEIKSDGTTSTKVTASMKASLSWGWISAQVSANVKRDKEVTTSKHTIVARMSTERYYASIDDTTATLTPDAQDLLGRGDVIGFFQACGSGFIRSIRRTAEISAIFTFESRSEREAMQMAADLKVKLFGRQVGGGSMSIDQKSSSTDTSMKIKIKAFGLGLNEDGADSLVAKTMEDYDKVMKFAFKSMQTTGVGMVQGVEIVPWVDSLQFQNTLNFNENTAKLNCVETDDSPCAATEVAHLGDDSAKPEIMLSPLEVKAVSTINAEFITTMEKHYRDQLNTVGLLRNCLGELQVLKRVSDNQPEDDPRGKLFEKALVDHALMDFQPQVGTPVAAKDLWTAFNGDSPDKNAASDMFNSLKAFITGFYGPCASAILKTSNDGRMTQFWWDLKACDTRCLDSDMVYVPMGETAPDNADCSKSIDNGHVQCCKNTQVAGGTIKYTLETTIERFCLPEFAEDIAKMKAARDVRTGTPAAPPASPPTV